MTDFKTTPDLSQEFHPVPKVYKAKKSPKPLKKVGKRTEAWMEGQPKLKEEFKEHGIVSCEIGLQGCKKTYLLGFAHVIRRGNFTIDELVDAHVVVLACQHCHTIVDDASQTPKPVAEKMLRGIVEERGW